MTDSISTRQTNFEYAAFAYPWLQPIFAARVTAVMLAILLCGCRSWPGGVYRSPLTQRVIEFKSGTAYITEGRSTQAIPYEVDGDKVVLKLPFTNEVLRRMPDGTLSGMGETLLKADYPSAIPGTYASTDGEYSLHLTPQGGAVYTRQGRSTDLGYTVNGDRITLDSGDLHIPVTRHADGSLETPDALLKKQS